MVSGLPLIAAPLAPRFNLPPALAPSLSEGLARDGTRKAPPLPPPPPIMLSRQGLRSTSSLGSEGLAPGFGLDGGGGELNTHWAATLGAGGILGTRGKASRERARGSREAACSRATGGTAIRSGSGCLRCSESAPSFGTR